MAESEAVAKTDKLTSPVVVVKDKAATQEAAAVKYDWLHSEAGHKAFADTLKQVGRLGAEFNTAWRQGHKWEYTRLNSMRLQKDK